LIAFAEALVANGITPRYWNNDNTQEVEFILQDGINAVPVEVKKCTRYMPGSSL